MDAERLAQYAALGGLPGRCTPTRHRLHDRCVDQVPGDEPDLQLVPANDVVDDDVVGAVVTRFGRARAIARASSNTISCMCNRSDLVGISDMSQAAGALRAPKQRSSNMSKATPMKTRCFGFPGQRILIAGDVVVNNMHTVTPQKRTVRLEGSG